jgi:hypothetical protein
MWAAGVVEAEVAPDGCPGLGRAGIGPQIDRLIGAVVSSWSFPRLQQSCRRCAENPPIPNVQLFRTNSFPLVSLVQPLLNRMALITGETSHLSLYISKGLVLVASCESSGLTMCRCATPKPCLCTPRPRGKPIWPLPHPKPYKTSLLNRLPRLPHGRQAPLIICAKPRNPPAQMALPWWINPMMTMFTALQFPYLAAPPQLLARWPSPRQATA